ncbi:hypothetical protein ACLOJK_038228 [Asimina triloba]
MILWGRPHISRCEAAAASRWISDASSPFFVSSLAPTPTPLLAIPSLQARPIRKWGRENKDGCEEVVVLKEKGIFEGLRARVQLQNLLPLLVGASSLLVPSVAGASSLLVPSVVDASSLLVPSVAGAPVSVYSYHAIFYWKPLILQSFAITNEFCIE